MEKLVFIKSTLFFLQLTLLLILEDKLHRQLSYDLLPSRFICKQIFVHECRSIAQWPWSGLGSDCVRHRLCLQPAFLSFLCWKSRLNPNICVWYQFLSTQTLTHSLWHVVVTCILKWMLGVQWVAIKILHFTLGHVMCNSWGNTSEFFPHSQHWCGLPNIFQRRRWTLLWGSPMALGKAASPQSRSSTAGSFLKHAGAFWRPCSWNPLTALLPKLKHKAWKLMLGSCCFTSSLCFSAYR